AFLTIGVVLGALAAGAVYAPRRAGRIVLGTIGAAWGGIAGLLGVILVLLWAFTEHAVTYRNENLFFINPLLLGLAVLIPWTLRSRSGAAPCRHAPASLRPTAGSSRWGCR